MNSERIPKTPENYQIPPCEQQQKRKLGVTFSSKDRKLLLCAPFVCHKTSSLIRLWRLMSARQYLLLLRIYSALLYAVGNIWTSFGRVFEYSGTSELARHAATKALFTQTLPQQCWYLNIRKIWCWCSFGGFLFYNVAIFGYFIDFGFLFPFYLMGKHSHYFLYLENLLDMKKVWL